MIKTGEPAPISLPSIAKRFNARTFGQRTERLLRRPERKKKAGRRLAGTRLAIRTSRSRASGRRLLGAYLSRGRPPRIQLQRYYLFGLGRLRRVGAFVLGDDFLDLAAQ